MQTTLSGMRMCLAAVMLLIGTIRGLAAGAPLLTGTVGATGLSSLQWRGQELIRQGSPQVRSLKLEHSYVDGRIRYEFEDVVPGEPEVLQDSSGRRIRQQYAWGTLTYTYALHPDRLDIGILLENRSGRTIASFDLHPLALDVPGGLDPLGPRGESDQKSMPEDLGLIEASFGDTRLLLGAAKVLPLRLTARRERNGAQMRIEVAGGVHITEPGGVHYHPYGLPRVPDGENLEIALSLRFAERDADLTGLREDFHAVFRSYHQPAMVWEDRRPIGAIFLPTGRGPANNPRNWFRDAKLDIRTDEGLAELRQRMLQFADQTVEQLRRMDAQGAVLWNPEGEENPHPISYIGDPRMVPILAPEMENILPAFARRITDAGFRFGVCLRPTQVYQEGGSWHHGTGSHSPERNPLEDDFSDIWPEGLPWWRFYPIVERMSRKIAYAREQYGATLFYIDTNGLTRGTGKSQQMSWTLLDSHIWRGIHERHPDVLLIPEFMRAVGQMAYTTVYLQPPYSSPITPDYVQRVFPDAFGVSYTVNLDVTDWYDRRDTFLRGVLQGDSFFFRGWFGDHYNDRIRELYQEADMLRRAPVAVPGEPGGRLGVLASGDVRMRHDVARALGEARDQRAVPALVNVLETDGNWVVRRAAAAALGHIGGEQAIAALSKLMQDQDSDLHYYAGRFLGLAGVDALPALEAALRPNRRRITWDSVARGVVRIQDPAAFPLMKRIMDERARPARWSQNTIMWGLAQNRPPEMFDDILSRLGTGSKNWDAEIANALAAYGDPRAIDPLIGILEREAGTQAADGRRAANAARDALEAITGFDGTDASRPSGGTSAGAWRKLLAR